MAQGRQDLIGRLADRGEEAVQRLGEIPGASRFVEVATGLRDRVDELQKRMRELTAIERRLADLEKKVDRLGAPSGSRKSTGSARKAAPKKASSAKSSTGTKRAPATRRTTQRKRSS
jgi:Skp family chaperone for outer membrane proteins